MTDLDRTEREHLLALLRQLGGMPPSAPPASRTGGPPPASSRLTLGERRRLMAHIERVAGLQRRAHVGGALHAHARELLEEALGSSTGTFHSARPRRSNSVPLAQQLPNADADTAQTSTTRGQGCRPADLESPLSAPIRTAGP